jgi:hypothetical protein
MEQLLPERGKGASAHAGQRIELGCETVGHVAPLNTWQHFRSVWGNNQVNSGKFAAE